MRRRTFIGTGIGAVLAGCRQKKAIQPDQHFTVSGLTEQYRKGDVTVDGVLDHYLARIKLLDDDGPRLSAIVELNPAMREYSRKGSLEGVPLFIKDNIETADQMETTAGSLALLGAQKPERDAHVVQRLRESGAVILGKTNLSEWANIRSPNSSSGWSARGGLTVNPHNTSYSASGSSSGSAVAVAAGFCAAAIGTETNGSIISPASACGIVGLKPTLGLVSRAGIIPITRWQDTAGPMTQNVRDAALLLNVLAGKDERDSMTQQAKIEADYTFGLADASFKGMRIGVLTSMSGMNKEVLNLFRSQLEKLKEEGAILVEDVSIPNHHEASSAAWIAMLTELRQEMNQYLGSRQSVVRSLAELIKYNEEFRDREMEYFNQEFFVDAESRHTPEHLEKAVEIRRLARRLSGPEGLDVTLEKHKVDALICPTNDPTGRIDLGLGDARSRIFGSTAAVAGYPHLTVPMGMVNDLPIGLSFVGPAWSENLLLRLGQAFENIREYTPPKLFV